MFPFYRLLFVFAIVAIISLPALLHAEVVHEQGSLRAFLGGSCEACAYDNWISHISEGVARPNYNDYGPVTLDPQLNGFGQYVQLADTGSGESPIDQWYNIFTAFFAADTHAVDSLLIVTQLDSVYALVILQDSARFYYVLREHLDLGYYDDQLSPEDSSDDVQGSFACGWGVYIFSPTATRSNVLIEAPHPEDDFVTPWITTDVFELWDAGCLMIAGAGREVAWTEQGTYDNSKSLSDPTRVAATVFHAAHRAFVNAHADHFALQLHSYDTATHPNRKSLVISAGADDGFPNEPILDRCTYDDMISLTPMIAVPANLAGDHPDVTVGDYYSMYYEGGYRYQGVNPQISTNNDLIGWGTNRQMQASHIGHDRYRHPENFIHIELDELPDALQDGAETFYQTDLPGGVTFANYQHALDYYRPAFIALEQSLDLPPMVELITPTPTTLNFGYVPVHQTETRYVQFQNISQDVFIQVSDASENSSAFDLFDIPTGTLLTPGEICSLGVEFQPGSAITYSTPLRLTTDQGCCHMELRGTGSGATIALTPDSLAFDSSEVGMPDTLTVACYNGGNATLRLFECLAGSPSARFLPPSDSTIGSHDTEVLSVEFTPQMAGTEICSVGVISTAYNLDTAWVVVTGTWEAIPQAVNDLVISFHDSNSIQLCWQASDSTSDGVPLSADGYIVLSYPHWDDPLTVVGYTSDTCFVHLGGLDESASMFYQVIAYYGSPVPPITEQQASLANRRLLPRQLERVSNE